MMICQACSAEIVGRDRFCRNCGAPVANSIGDLVDTCRLDPNAQSSATAQPGSPDPTNPLYTPPPAAYAAAPGVAPSYQTASVGKQPVRRKFVWPAIFLPLSLFLAMGIIIGRDAFQSRQTDRQAERAEIARRSYEEAIQNALGFRTASVSDAEYPTVRGVFVNNLMSDDSPAALANLQAGDVLTDLNDQVVRNNGELAQALEPLQPGAEVVVKVYRDGEIINSRIKVADRAFPPLLPKVEPRDQGYLGIKDSGRRCCIPGTKKWGVEIYETTDNTPVDIFGLREGDLITEFDGHAIRTTHELNRRIRAAKPQSKVLVKFYRSNTQQTVELILGHRW
ncbi:MAG: PDZ domain-containing protein [Blastocatellia bacterium]